MKHVFTQRRSDRSLRTLARVAFATVALVVAGAFAVLALGIVSLQRDSNQRRFVVLAIETTARSERSVLDLESGLRAYLLTGERRYLGRYQQALATLPGELSLLRSEVRADPMQTDAVRSLGSAILAYERSYATPVASESPPVPQSQIRALTAEGERLNDGLRGRFESLERLQEDRRQRGSNAAASSRGLLLWLAGSGVLITILLLGGLWAYLTRSILAPVSAVARAAARRQSGETNVQVPERGQGEIRALEHAFNEMSATLDRRERDLRITHDRLRAILDHAQSIIYIKDLDGRYVLVNRAFEEARNLNPEDVIGRTETAFSPPEIADQIAEDDRWVAETGERLTAEYTVPTPEGMRTYLSVKFPIPDAENDRPVIAGVSTDITAHKQALDAAVEASRLKSQFVANMSHEIRTPLGGVLGMAQLLARTELDKEQRTYLEVLRASGEALLSVIGDILDFSKIEAGRLELDPTEFELARLVEESCLIVAEKAANKGLELKCKLDPALPAFVLGDRGRLRQILLNLLSNAVKFTSAGVVSVCVAPEGDLVRFDVTDTGIGVAPEQAEMLFDAFEQGDNSTTRKYGGTGLGLTIARELVELMSGEITARPNDVGAGSTFSFTASLPEAGTASVAPHNDAERDSVADEAAPAPRRVLIAEDNDVNRLVATTMLEQRGLIVDTAHDGVEAVQMHADGDYAAIFMDCEMPELDGYEATRRIRASETAQRIPIIALSAHAVGEARDDCLAAGMDDYVSKPLTSDQLERALARWLPWHSDDGGDSERGAGEVEQAEPDLLDNAVVDAIRADFDPGRRRQLMETFDATVEDCLTRIDEAVITGNAEEMARVAHLLKGSSATVGARRLSEACRELGPEELEELRSIAEHTQQALAVSLLD